MKQQEDKKARALEERQRYQDGTRVEAVTSADASDGSGQRKDTMTINMGGRSTPARTASCAWY